MSPEARTVAKRELRRLKRIPPQSVEHGVVRTYLDTLVSLPWSRKSAPAGLEEGEDLIDRARRQLDEDHFGLEKVKKRLIEFLAVVKLGAEKEEMERRREVEEGKVKVQGSEGQLDEVEGNSAGEDADKPASDALTTTTTPPSEPASPAHPIPGPGSGPSFTTASKPQRLSPVPIILLVGPPGVGKTSIARSLAHAMGRKFHRIALGGVRDEAEIRGHRRTYVGAMPGLIVQALRKVECADPVVLLDEVDKISNGGFHGDPGAALLEVLDGEQNWAFNDHYVNVPVDLSECLFIATANTLDTISPPLLDRMEVIELGGYVTDEKLAIARRHLLPKQTKANVLLSEHVSISDEVLTRIITHYTLEAGVRSLEREIGSVCRSKAVEYASARASAKTKTPTHSTVPIVPPGYNPLVTLTDLERILGPARFEEDLADAESRPGVVTGLSVTGGIRGNIMRVEATSMAGNGELKLTGSLGDVMRESAQIAMSWIKANAVDLGLAEEQREKILEGVDLHVHFPAGAIPKDGPSGGVTLVTSLVSLLRDLSVRPTLAMTGEITLRGLVTPVGGVREKTLAAHRSGCTTVILPEKNRRDVDDDLRKSLGDEVEIVFVKTLWDVLGVAFGERLRKTGKGRVVWRERSGALESRL